MPPTAANAWDRALPWQLFQQSFSTRRAVRIPAGATGSKRQAFVRAVRTALDQVAALARRCDSVLGPTGTPTEERGWLVFTHDAVRPCTIPREPPEAPPDPHTLWWITWGALRAAAEADARRVVHGGLQPRALGVDRAGRIRLADFGLAPIAETTGGRDQYQRSACDARSTDTEPGGLAVIWSLADDDAQREDGWISPYFAPEILAATARPNPVSDQFSLGVVLYQLATGVHPRGADFSDPDLFGYFVPEMLPLEEQVAGWAESFARVAGGTARDDDEAIVAWGTLVGRLLAQEVEDRFGSFADALRAAEAHIPPVWIEADAALAEAAALLAAEEFDAFLAAAGPWAEHPDLPAAWRQALTAGIAQVETDRKRTAARSTLAARLDQAGRTLDAGDPQQARAIVDEILAEPDADETVRRRATELRQLCDEHEQMIAERADELASANIAAAREAIEGGEFGVARVILTGMCEDELTSEAPRAEAQALLADIDAREQRFATQQAALDEVRQAFAQGRIATASEQLDALAADPALAAGLREQVEKLRHEVEETRRRREDALRRIAQAHDAIEAADPQRAEEALALLPADIRDEELRAQRDALLDTCTRIRDWRGRLDAAEILLRSGQADEALDAARALCEAPPVAHLTQVAEDLTRRCEHVIAQMTQAHVEDALRTLARAEDALDAGEVEAAQRALSMVLPLADKLAQEDRARADTLAARVRQSEAALRQTETAARHLRQDALDQARAALDEIDPRGLPEPVAARVGELTAQIEQRRQVLDEQHARALAAAIERAEAHLAEGKTERARELYEQAPRPDTLPDDLAARCATIEADIRRQHALTQALRKAENALRRGDPTQAGQQLDDIAATAPDTGASDLPGWAATRIDALRQQIAQAAQRQSEQAHQAAREAVDEARAAIARGEIGPAEKQLDLARKHARDDAALRTECDAIEQALAALREALPRLSEAQAALEREETATAQRLLAALRRHPPPEALLPRMQALEQQTEAAIAAHRSRLDDELERFAALATRRGRRARALEPHIVAIETDALATPHHKRRAADLLAAYRAAPVPRKGRWIALATVVVLGGAATAWFLRQSSSHTATPNPASVVATRPSAAAPPSSSRPAPARPPSETSSRPVATSEQQPSRPLASAPPPWPVTLEPRTLRSPNASTLETLFAAFVSRVDLGGANPPAARLEGLIRELTITREDKAGGFTLHLTPIDDQGEIAASFSIESSGGRWRPVAANGEILRRLTGEVVAHVRETCAQAATNLENAYVAGKLLAAYQQRDAAQRLGPVLDRTEFAQFGRRVREIDQRLPPRWRPVAGMTESTKRDADTGYPVTLDHAGRRLVLISMPPADAMWETIRAVDEQTPAHEGAAGYDLARHAQAATLDRPWLLFYIEAEEGTNRVDRDPAAAAAQRGLALPTVEQWLATAMRNPRNAALQGLVGGSWEWCRRGNQTWVCGGCDALHGRFLPPPAADAPPLALWEWLNHPLVSQPRERGDGLATVRGVFAPTP